MRSDEAVPDMKVVYRPPHIPHHQPGEEGVVVRVNQSYVFVRFGNDVHSRACYPDTLKPVTLT